MAEATRLINKLIFQLGEWPKAASWPVEDGPTNEVSSCAARPVMLCGQATTTYSKIPAARHRVLNNNKGRFSIWYEVGIKSQIQLKYKITKKRLEQLALKKMMEVDVYFDSSSKTKSFNVPVDGALSNIKNQMEISEGLPTSKIVSYVEPSFKRRSYSQDDVKIGDSKHWRATRDGFLVKRENDYGSYAPFDGKHSMKNLSNMCHNHLIYFILFTSFGSYL